MNYLFKIYLRIVDEILINIYYPLFYLFHELFSNNYEIVTASIHPMYHNWGDDVSIQICKLINPKIRYIPNRYTWNINHKYDVLCVGSIITWMTSSDSIIWGSGVVYSQANLSSKPKQVLAVRGPLTRQYLIKHGVQCPEIYGDPALLLPRFYTPKYENKHKIGIIPHFRDKNHPLMKKLLEDPTTILIDVTRIKPWHKFIDDICSCECVISSSLHGIIVSDAYHIPNLWIEFDRGESKRFAFYDYFQSIKANISDPFCVTEETTLDELAINCRNKTLDINLERLLSVCPFYVKG